MADAEVRVALDHRERGPAAELAQHRQRRAGLHVPAGPRVAQVVKAQPRQAGAIAGLAPRVIAYLPARRVGDLHGLVVGVRLRQPARHRENPAAVPADLPAQDVERGVVQRHRDIAPGLGLVGVYPRGAALEVDLLPAQQPHVRFAQAGGERESGHGAQVIGQLGEQRGGLLAREPGDAARGLVQLGDRRHAGEPAAAVRVVQDLAELGQVAIHGGGAAAIARVVGAGAADGLRLALGGELADRRVGDVGQRAALQAGAEPAQAQLDVFDAAAVAVVRHPGEDGGVPGYAGRFPESFDAPEIARKARGVFLRRALVRGASAALNALAVDREVNPERAALSAGVDAHAGSSLMYWVRSQSITSASTST